MPSGVHAILAVDPGGTTGIAAGHYELLVSMKRTVSEGQRMHKTTEVTGYWLDQAKAIAELVNRFKYTAQVEHQLPASHLHVVFENYLPDPRRIGAGATDLSPVWIAAAACAYLDEEPVWQNPADKSYATNALLKRWGLWVVGSEHMRDANRHLCKRLDRLLQGGT